LVGNDGFFYSLGGYKYDEKYKKRRACVLKSETPKANIKIFKTFTFCKGKFMSCNMPSNYTTKVHTSLYNSCDIRI